MTVHELQQEILRLKREKNICILAHAYQSQPVLEVADYTGDSYGLSVQAAKTNADGVIMCGVRFMAETCKILSPEKTVWLANPMAGCPMAEQLDLATLQELKKQCKPGCKRIVSDGHCGYAQSVSRPAPPCGGCSARLPA